MDPIALATPIVTPVVTPIVAPVVVVPRPTIAIPPPTVLRVVPVPPPAPLPVAPLPVVLPPLQAIPPPPVLRVVAPVAPPPVSPALRVVAHGIPPPTLTVVPGVPVPPPGTPAAPRRLTLAIAAPAVTKDSLIQRGMGYLTAHQREIIAECEAKGSGCMFLPMGTGKTLLSILMGLIHSNRYPGSKILVVVSKTLITTWREEVTKFFGDSLKVEVLHKEFVKDFASWVPTADIVLTTVETIGKIYVKYDIAPHFWYVDRPERFGPEVKYYRVPDAPYLHHGVGDGCMYSVKWAAVVVDEGHNFLNPTTNRCLAIASLSAHHRWILSGTILEEPKGPKLFGYHLMLNHADAPRNLPDFLKYIDTEEYPGVGATLVKRDGNPDFAPPPVRKEIVSHPLSATEARIYTGLKALLNVLKARVNDFKARGDTVNTKKFSSFIMGMLGHLRQCLICPMIPITSVALDVADCEQRSELSDMFMQVIRDMHIDEYLADTNSLRSSRVAAVCDKAAAHANERVIIFSCYRTAIDVVRTFLPNTRPVFTIEGNDKMEKRSTVIEQFRASANGILLLTYEIGANGLNLQCASTAILMDFWWNAGKSDQAVARLLRPGQAAAAVNLYYFTANTGMENAIFKLHESKKDMGAEILVGRMTTTATKIKVEEIIALINTDDNIQILDKLIG